MENWMKIVFFVADVFCVIGSFFLIFAGEASIEHYVYAVCGTVVGVCTLIELCKKQN